MINWKMQKKTPATLRTSGSATNTSKECRLINPILTCTDRQAIKEKIASRVSLTDSGCLEWQHSLDRYGYGRFRVQTPDGIRQTGAHRAAWLAAVGDIDDPSLEIDHLCRNRKCVNINHLELVTSSINSTRSDHSAKRGRSGRKAGSPPGCQRHGLDNGMYRTRRDGYTVWDCRTCAAVRQQKWLAKRAA